ncbi:AGE family epimerase/isomerase [Sinorhizobium meliloti]|uniref:AGE family epimerase/isomerase n=1 Tax=Rhizobium meliloti TaxID=382 RepID=UPI0012949893|nr:AGE family epimerase/isomerase [Sinorhizobium meliloti]MQX30735.1 AGE family epimerase/isomerase [Sinorhizobium meliloti]
MKPIPDFRSKDFLLAHMREIMDFYHPICLNEEDGGYYNEYRDDGFITDRKTQHLVSTTRFIFNYATAAVLFERPDFAEAAAHGVRYLDKVHRDPEHGGYFWLMRGGDAVDATKHCYGHAFVLLAYATAMKAGIPGTGARVSQTWDLLENRFREPDRELYKDEVSRDWGATSPYRGQNANMHMTEAMLAAYEATGEIRYLDRAETLARRICVELAANTQDVVWEHYRQDWSVDWDYNKDDPKHLFRPYGYQPGHMTEWTKLLLILERYRPQDWILPKALLLYETALAKSADLEFGGMHYSYGPEGKLYDLDKYHWVHCETIAAAAALAGRTGRERYWQDYDRLWRYSWRHLIDHEYGCWFRILSPDGVKQSDIKSPSGKTDYHPFGACYEILRVLGEAQ